MPKECDCCFCHRMRCTCSRTAVILASSQGTRPAKPLTHAINQKWMRGSASESEGSCPRESASTNPPLVFPGVKVVEVQEPEQPLMDGSGVVPAPCYQAKDAFRIPSPAVLAAATGVFPFSGSAAKEQQNSGAEGVSPRPLPQPPGPACVGASDVVNASAERFGFNKKHRKSS